MLPASEHQAEGVDPDTPDTAARAKALFGEIAGRSPLQDWMRENHAVVTHQLKASRPRWNDIARALTEQGIRDANGDAPKAETVRRAWQRVTGVLGPKKRRATRGKAAKPAPVTSADAATAPPSPAPLPASEPPQPTASGPAAPPATPLPVAPLQPAAAPSPAQPAPAQPTPPTPAASDRSPVDLSAGINPPARPKFGSARPRQ